MMAALRGRLSRQTGPIGQSERPPLPITRAATTGCRLPHGPRTRGQRCPCRCGSRPLREDRKRGKSGREPKRTLPKRSQAQNAKQPAISPAAAKRCHALMLGPIQEQKRQHVHTGSSPDNAVHHRLDDPALRPQAGQLLVNLGPLSAGQLVPSGSVRHTLRGPEEAKAIIAASS